MAKHIDRYSATKDQPIRTVSMLGALTCAKPALALLRPANEKYHGLIDAITAVGEYDSLPTVRQLHKQLGIGEQTVRNRIESLYKDFLEIIREEPGYLSFSEVEYHISIYGLRSMAGFFCHMKETPRIGETLYFPFVGCIVEGSSYHVTGVTRMYENGKTLINIVLRDGGYNAHAMALLERARFERKITLDDEYRMNTAELHRFLRQLYP